MTATMLRAEMMNSYQLQCSISTFQRRLRQHGLFGSRPVKKPLISAKNRKARVEFARKHLNWNQQQWSKVLFSDESKFNLFVSDSIKWIIRPINQQNNPKYQLPTVKHGGGNIMI
jgi:Transposase